VLAGKIETSGRTIGLIASGGNVDAALFAEIITDKA
jgi:threonine dehydratase